MSGFEIVESAAARLRKHWPHRPTVAIVLGSGLGELADQFDEPVQVDYSEIPGFVLSTAIGHRGRLVFGHYAGEPVVAMQGRFHLYEGHKASVAALPIRVMHALGAQALVVSNAAGGLNPNYRVGELMVIDDHINFMFRGPLVGLNAPEWGQRFPDMSAPYDKRLADAAIAAARRGDFVCHRGVYVGMLGPTYETRAEYRMARGMGGDVVGMSTVPEVIVARQLGMRVFGVSVVTNACSPDQLGTTSGEAVVEVANREAERLATLVTAVVESAK